MVVGKYEDDVGTLVSQRSGDGKVAQDNNKNEKITVPKKEVLHRSKSDEVRHGGAMSPRERGGNGLPNVFAFWGSIKLS